MPPHRALAVLLVLVPGVARCRKDAAEGAAGHAVASALPAAGGHARGLARRAAAGGLLAVGRSPRAAEVRTLEVRGHDAGPAHVTASPDVQVEEPRRQQGEKRWDWLESRDGGNDKLERWRTKMGGGTLPWLAAVVFIVLIGILPLLSGGTAVGLTKTHVLESCFLYIWLLGGLYLFTNVVIFQSPHFEHPRTLCLEESVYLYAQILTTVGYGDITPARPRGQLCVGLFVFTAVLLIASMVQEMLAVCENMMEETMDTPRASRTALEQSYELDQQKSSRAEEAALKKAFEPVVYASIVFCCFAAGGATFFTCYPGEEKTLAQAVYMSLITLSTVGFGAFTPSTHTGMVVAAYWMMFGCSSLMAVITSRAAFALALKAHEIKLKEEEEQRRLGPGTPPSSRWNTLKAGVKAASRFSKAQAMKDAWRDERDLYNRTSPKASGRVEGERLAR